MINSIAFLKRKLFYGPLVNFKSEDPIFTNLEEYLNEKLSSEDQKEIEQKEIFFKNLRIIHNRYKNLGDMDLRIMLYLNMPLILLLGIFLLRLSSDLYGSDPFLTLGILFMIIRPFYVVYNFLIGFYELKRMEATLFNTNTHLSQSIYSDVWNPIIEISSAINLDLQKLKVIYVKENHYIPTVTDLKRIGTKLIAITIPRNLLALSKQKPKLYKAIIAHELSHVIQGDSGIWMYYKLDSRCAYNIKDFILNLIEGKTKRLKRKYKIYNSSAEFLADLGSILLTGNLDILEFLRGPYISDDEAEFHPTKQTRILFLKSLLYQQAKIAFT